MKGVKNEQLDYHCCHFWQQEGGREVKLYNDRGDKYYLFGQFELYLMLIQCVLIGILVALTYGLIRLGGGV